MKARGLQQKGLAEVLGVSLDRVKSLTSGKVKNLTREEHEALVKKLNVNADWLITGEGPMFEEETDEEYAEQIRATNRVRAIVEAMPLPEISRKRLQAILTGDPAQDGPLIADALRGDSGAIAPTRPKADDRAKAPPTREELAVGTRADPAWPMVMELVYDELNARKRRMSNGAEFRKLVDAVLVVLRLEEKGELDREKTRRKIDAFL